MDSKINFQSLDPAERDWEYDGAGGRMYRGTRTPYNDDYEIWKQRFGQDWHDSVEQPYYVGMP